MKSSPALTLSILSALAKAGLAAPNDTSSDPILKLSEDESFHFEILTGLGQAQYSGVDVGPVLMAAKNIIPGDWDSFTEVWLDLANSTKAQALDPAIAYDPVNVRATWFSVANYFRRADVFVREDWDDPRINDFWNEQRAAFDKAIAALPVPGQRVQIPADGFTVEAIWYSPTPETNSSERRPTIILGNGFDAAQEDMFATVGAPALDRGYNVISYEGPGQPTVRREQNVGFIPDWERVVTPVVDYLLSEKAAVVDPDQLVLYGNSLGGYFNARAAAFEPRLAALMLNGGIWDAYEGYAYHLPDELLELQKSGQKEAFDEAIFALFEEPETSTTVKWGVLQGLWSYMTESPYEWFEMLKEYTIRDVADQIQMPTWIAEAEFEHAMQGQSEQVRNALGDWAEMHLFKDSAGYHCQSGAAQELNRVMFAWLNKTLNKA